MIMIINKIILRGSVENNNNQPYLVNNLTVIISTFVLRNCYYSLMKPIQSFVSHCSTAAGFPPVFYFSSAMLHNIYVYLVSSVFKSFIDVLRESHDDRIKKQ